VRPRDLIVDLAPLMSPWSILLVLKKLHTVANPFEIFQTILNKIQTCSNLIRFKQDLPELENLEIKYGFEGFDERNNFAYRNFLRFEMYFELKFKENSRV
jgi:hypothetical protein